MSSLKEEELKNILPINGPSVEEVKKYIDKYNDELIVIKCGGSVLLDPNLFDIFIKDVAVLKKIGLSPIIVHGGGPKIKKKLSEGILRLTLEKEGKTIDFLTLPNPLNCALAAARAQFSHNQQTTKKSPKSTKKHFILVPF